MFKKIVCGMMVLMLVVGCSSQHEKKLGSLNEIGASQVLRDIEDKKDMILVIGTSTCESCIEYVALINDYIKENKVNFNLVEIDSEPIIKDDQGKESRPSFLELEEKIGTISLTPTTFFIKNGEIINIVSGVNGYEDLVKAVEDNGFIK
ncbi:MAG: thioredoxin family protein [Erysipelotrichaceae bacterium]